MTNDRYLRVVLGVIAAALVYLCVVLTPLPAAFAQTTQRPGQFVGPGEMVIVGVRLPAGQAMPVEAPGPLQVQVSNEVRVTGQVRAEQPPNTYDRVMLMGWEDNSSIKPAAPGTFMPWSRDKNQALPIQVVK